MPLSNIRSCYSSAENPPWIPSYSKPQLKSLPWPKRPYNIWSVCMHTQMYTFQWLALSKSFPPLFLLFPCGHTDHLMFLKYSRQAPAPDPLHLLFSLPVTFLQFSTSILFHFFCCFGSAVALSERLSLTIQYKTGIPYQPIELPSPSHLLFSLPCLTIFLYHIFDEFGPWALVCWLMF